MGLKYRIRTRDEVPEEQRGLYAEREGGWVLDVEGAVDKAKLDEFRTTNVALLKERDELQQRFAGIDPDEVRSLRTASLKAAEEAQLKAGEFEKVLWRSTAVRANSTLLAAPRSATAPNSAQSMPVPLRSPRMWSLGG